MVRGRSLFISIFFLPKFHQNTYFFKIVLHGQFNHKLKNTDFNENPLLFSAKWYKKLILLSQSRFYQHYRSGHLVNHPVNQRIVKEVRQHLAMEI